jgi:S-formylglutathione hydrolase FrmB
MLVYLPASYAKRGPLPLVIALHGWGHRPEVWRDRSDIGSLADKHAVVVACPDMGTTVYETMFFPESRKRWNAVPGATWILQTVLPYARSQFRVSREPRFTAIIGYSTGGRGAVLLGERSPEFGFCGSLSGTYDLGLLHRDEGEYKIHSYVYGERSAFLDRWKEDDCVNPRYAASLTHVSLYLAHGARDQVVKVSQAQAMAELLTAFHKDFQIVITRRGKHDWGFWNSQLPALFGAMQTAFYPEPTTRRRENGPPNHVATSQPPHGGPKGPSRPTSQPPLSE